MAKRLLLLCVLFSVLASLVTAWTAAECEKLGGNCFYDPGPCGSCSEVGVMESCVGTKKWAITIDDGPDPLYTQVLEILRKENVKATFAILGDNVNKNAASPKLQQIVNDGHQLIVHSMTHPNLKTLSNTGVAEELNGCYDLINKQITGKPIEKYMRPPQGEFKNSQREYIQNTLKYTIVMWNFDPKDYENTTSTTSIITQTQQRANTGQSTIQLLHCLRQQSVDALQQSIQAIKSAGYTFVRIDECKSGSTNSTNTSVVPKKCTEGCGIGWCGGEVCVGDAGYPCTSDDECGDNYYCPNKTTCVPEN